MLRAFSKTIVTELAERGWDLNPCLAFTKMSNSFELLRGPIETIQQKYEILSDIVTEYNGKVHGSQSHIISNNSISLIVYYEVSQGHREEVKAKYQNIIRNEVKIYHQQ